MIEAANEIDPPTPAPRVISVLPLDARLAARSRLGSAVVAVVVIALGCLGLVGWLFDIRLFKIILPGYPTMKANAAIGFIAAGLSLWLVRTDKIGWMGRLGSRACAGVAVLIGFLSWIEFGLSVDYPIDERLLKEAHGNAWARLPSWITAFHFTICGISLLLFDFQFMRRFRPSIWLSLLGTCTSVFVILAYVYGARDSAYLHDSPVLALPTVAPFPLVFIGILLARPDRDPIAILLSDSLGGLIARKVLPTLLVTLSLLGIVSDVAGRAGLVGLPVGLALFVIASMAITSEVLLWQARAVGLLEIKRRSAEVSLEVSEATFRQLADAMPQIVWTSDPDGLIDYYNERWYEFTGFSRDKTGDESWKPILHPDDLQKCLDDWYRAVRTGEPYEIEYRFFDRKSGGYRWQLGRALPVRDASGQITRWFGTSTDIDDRKRAEEARQEGEERFRALIETLPQLVWGTRPDGAHEYASPQWADYLGYDSMDEVGARWLEAMHPEDQHGFLTTCSRALETGQTIDTEHRLRRHDGEFRWFKARGVPVRGAGGQILRWLGTSTDIDDQKRGEEALRSSERIYRTIGESIPFGIWISDPEGRNTYLSESFLNLIGKTQEQCSKYGWMEILHPDEMEITREAWKECVRTESIWEREHRFRGTDGLYHTTLSRGGPVRDDEGRIICWAGINLDISRQKATEEALRTSEQRQRLALSAARLSYWEWDLKNDRVTYLEQLTMLYGRSQDHPFTDSADYLSIVHPDDRAKLHRGIERALELNVPYEAEYRVIWPDESVHWLTSQGVAIYDPDGTPTRFVGVNLDITERKDAEAQIRLLNDNLESRIEERTVELATAYGALHSEEQRFRAIFDSTFQFIAVLSSDGSLLEINQTALDFSGLLREDVIGRPFWETPWWTHSADLQSKLRESIASALEGNFVRFVTEHPIPGDSWISVDTSLKPIYDEAGKVILLISEGRDITEQREAAEALRRSEAALRESHRLAGVGTWEWDVDIDVVTWSDELYRIAGRDPSLPAPRYSEQSRIYTPESIARLDQAVSNALSTGEPYEIELEMISESGDNCWIIGRGEVVSGPGIRAVKLRGTVQDVTARKRFEEKLRRARDEAMAGTQARSEFLANMSHEIRTPMNGVIGMTELLLATPLNQLQSDYARTIRSSGEALLTVINDILDFSKIEAGKLTMEIVEFDLRGLIDEVADLLAPRARQKGLEFLCQVDREVSWNLKGDPIRIRQILTNLAGNAVKFTDSGRVAIEARLVESSDDQVTVKVSVQDSGIGIPEDLQAQVFESFTQVEQSSNRRHGGTGLGLTICRSLVSLMDGQIGMESTVGVGSTFWFEMTLGRGNQPTGEANADRGPCRVTAVPVLASDEPSSSTNGSAVLAPPIRILLAEDNDVNRRVANGLLARLGCSVETVENGRAAVEALDYERHDLILMDVQMPEMDGFAATAMIREREKRTGKRIPIVAMTAHAMRGDSEKCIAAGMDDYLSKPLRPELLRATVLAWGLKTRRNPPEPEPLPTAEGPSTLLETLRRSFGDSREIIDEILELLVTSTPGQLELLEAAISSGNARQVCWEAHSLKGVFLSVGAELLAGECQELDECAERGELHSLEAIRIRILDHWSTLEASAKLCLDRPRAITTIA